MASNVNTKFVVILSLSLVVLVLGVSGLMFYSNMKSATRNIDRAENFLAEAEQLRAQGDEAGYYEAVRQAARQYGSAVNKETGNFELMETWVTTLERTNPDTDAEYQKLFDELRQGIKAMARLQPTNAAAKLREVEFDYELIMLRTGGMGSDQPLTFLIDDITQALGLLPADDPATLRIRGFRGLAQVQRMLITQVPEEESALALEDLQAAIAADPGFDEAEFGVVQWHGAMVQQYTLQSRNRLAEEQQAEQVRVLDELATLDPQNLRIRALQLRQKVNEAISDPAIARTDVSALANEGRAEIGEMILSGPGERIDNRMFRVLLSSNALPVGDPELLKRVLEHVIEGNPQSPEHILFSGRQLALAGQFDEAIETLTPLTDPSQMPRPELSINGVIFPAARTSAMFEIADAALTQAERSTQESEERGPALALVRGEDGSGGVRALIKERIGVQQEANLKIIDARLQLLDGNPREASALLNDARSELGDDPRVLYYLAVANGRIGNDGVARELLERVLNTGAFQNQPTRRYIASLEYAQLLTRLDEFARAAALLDNIEATYGSQQIIGQLRGANEAQYSAALRSDRIRLTEEIGELQDQVAAAPAGSAEQRRLQRLAADTQRNLDAVNDAIAGLATDPVADRIEQIRVLESSEGFEAAIAQVRALRVENPEDPRVAAMEIQVLARAGMQDEALQVAQAARDAFPGLPAFQEYADRLSSDDPLQFIEDEINSDESLTQAEKLMRLAQVYRMAGRDDEANDYVEQAVATDETDRSVVEYTFGVALAARDFAEAERIAEIGTANNTDNLNGLTYDGRIALVRGDAAEAVRIFEEARDRLRTDPSVSRFLARSYQAAGRQNDAIEELQRAHEGRPTDPIIAREYAAALRNAGDITGALAVVGPDGPVAEMVSREPGLRDLYLSLLAAQGNASRAIESRRRTFETNPADGVNTIALIELLVNANRYAEARTVMEQVRGNEIAMGAVSQRTPSGSASLLLAIVEGEMLLRTNRVDEAKSTVMSAFEAAQSELNDPRPAIATARFLLTNAGNGATWASDGVEVLRNARGLQRAGDMSVDSTLADQTQALAQAAEQRASQLEGAGESEAAAQLRADAERYRGYAVESLTAIVDAPDDAAVDRGVAQVRLAAIERERGDDAAAQQILTRVLAADPNNLDALLLSAQIASGGGNDARARTLLDTAVAAHQDNYRPFIARALLNASDERLRPDVMQDLDIVNRLAPEASLGWQLRFQLAQDAQQIEQAASRLRAAIEASPLAAPALTEILVNQLIGVGRADEAAQAAAEQADADPENARWQSLAANLSVNTGRFRPAVTFYQRLLSLAEARGLDAAQGQAALGILNAQVRGELNPPRGEVQRMVGTVDQLLPERSIQADLVLARAMLEADAREDGLRRIRAAYDRASESSAGILEFVRELDFGLGSTEEARQYVELLLAQGGSEAPLMIRVASVNNKLGVGLLNQQTFAEAEAVLADATSAGDPLAQFEILKTLTRMTYGLERFEDSVGYAERALDINPNAIDVNNDLAFVLAKHMDRAEEAVPFAERALSLNPRDANILDTIGFVFLESGRIDEAIRVLNLAVAAADTATERVPANVHLAQAYLAQGDTNRAADHAARARRALPDAAVIIMNTYTEDLAALEAQINAGG